jgi:hypothetical protein
MIDAGKRKRAASDKIKRAKLDSLFSDDSDVTMIANPFDTA